MRKFWHPAVSKQAIMQYSFSCIRVAIRPGTSNVDSVFAVIGNEKFKLNLIISSLPCVNIKYKRKGLADPTVHACTCL